MKTRCRTKLRSLLPRLFVYWLAIAPWAKLLGAPATNIPPQVRITYPVTDTVGIYSAGLLKIKAEAFDPDGSIAEVRFYSTAWSEPNRLRGIVTNPPYNLVVREFPLGPIGFTAVARDNLGAESRFHAWTFMFRDPISTYVETKSTYGTIVPAGADLEVTVDLVSSLGFRTLTFPYTLYFDDQVIDGGVFPLINPTNAPIKHIIKKVSEGTHTFYADYRQGGALCDCLLQRIDAVNLGLRQVNRTWDSNFEFELITAFPGKETMIETSTNLVHWTALQSVRPETNYFRFSTPLENTQPGRWYRAVIPQDARP